MTRYHAAFYHMLISVVAFVALAYLVIRVWFPTFFFSIDGGWEGMQIIIAVDLILGPTLTLVVFKAGKPGLRFDLAMIGLFQSVCLAGGVYVVYSERPLFFVYYDQHFYSSSADTYTRYGITAPDPNDFADALPAYVASELPDNPIEEADMRRILYQDGIPAWAYHKTYRQLDARRIITEGALEADMRERDTAQNLDVWLDQNGGDFKDFAFFPIHSRYRDAFVAIRRSDLEFTGIVEIPPPM